MRKIWTIAKAIIRNAREDLDNRKSDYPGRAQAASTQFAAGVRVLAIATVFFMSRWTPGEQDKMIIDIGIGAISFFGVVLSMESGRL